MTLNVVILLLLIKTAIKTYISPLYIVVPRIPLTDCWISDYNGWYREELNENNEIQRSDELNVG